MREEFLVSKSKYDFLWSVHPAFGEADIMTVSWKPQLRQSLMKFLLCDHKLEVETMRYGPWVIEKEDRICEFCAHLGGQILGNETHVLDDCLQFCEYRQRTLESLSQVGIDIIHGSIHTALEGLDTYPKYVRHKVWYAVALFTMHIDESRKNFRL